MGIERDNSVEVGGLRLTVTNKTGQWRELRLRPTDDCDEMLSAEDYEYNNAAFLSMDLMLSDDQVLELLEFAEPLMQGNEHASREDINSKVITPIEGKALQLESAAKSAAAGQAKVVAATDAVQAEALYHSKLNVQETVNGYEIQVFWVPGNSDRTVSSVRGGHYEIYFPQVERGIDMRVSDQVIILDQDDARAERVFDFAKAQAQTAKTIYQLYLNVENAKRANRI